METTVLRSLFPKFKSTNFNKINLNDLVKEHFNKGSHLMKDPSKKQDMINCYHKAHNCISYGGWMENRSFMWSGTYMDKDRKYIHLGVDIAVNKGNLVTLPFDAKVIDLLFDEDTSVGWGTRVIVKPKGNFTSYILFAHLADEINFKLGSELKKGSTIGKIGSWPKNGNVFEHLHLQAIERIFFETMQLSNLDG